MRALLPACMLVTKVVDSCASVNVISAMNVREAVLLLLASELQMWWLWLCNEGMLVLCRVEI